MCAQLCTADVSDVVTLTTRKIVTLTSIHKANVSDVDDLVAFVRTAGTAAGDMFKDDELAVDVYDDARVLRVGLQGVACDRQSSGTYGELSFFATCALDAADTQVAERLRGDFALWSTVVDDTRVLKETLRRLVDVAQIVKEDAEARFDEMVAEQYVARAARALSMGPMHSDPRGFFRIAKLELPPRTIREESACAAHAA